jgi:hypothetical protein
MRLEHCEYKKLNRRGRCMADCYHVKDRLNFCAVVAHIYNVHPWGLPTYVVLKDCIGKVGKTIDTTHSNGESRLPGHRSN